MLEVLPLLLVGLGRLVFLRRGRGEYASLAQTLGKWRGDSQCDAHARDSEHLVSGVRDRKAARLLAATTQIQADRTQRRAHVHTEANRCIETTQ